jgi:hypothetical protein
VVGRKPKLTADQLDKVRDAVNLKRSLPSTAEWARIYGIRPSALQKAIRQGYKHHGGAHG